MVPDYIGLQNNPNWVPTAADYNEACKFLPVEGTTMVTVGDRSMTVEYPGLAEAHKATSEALAGLASRPKLLGPETSGFAGVADASEERGHSPEFGLRPRSEWMIVALGTTEVHAEEELRHRACNPLGLNEVFNGVEL